MESNKSVQVTFALMAMATVAIHAIYIPAELFAAFYDDFFYYAEIAKRIVAGDGSSFNGLYATNGYHPLWMVCLLLPFGIANWLAIDPLIPTRLFLALVCGWGSYLIAGYILNSHARSIGLRVGLSAFAICFYLHISRSGMEVALTVPLFVLLLQQCKLQNLPDADEVQWFIVGLLGALTILSRIDSIIMVGFLGLIVLIYQRPKITHIVMAGFGALPVALYLASNLYLFDSLFPISGMAKSVEAIAGFHITTLITLFGGTFSVFATAASIVTLLALVIHKPHWAALSTKDKAIGWTAFIVPWLFIIQTGMRSDWPLWFWYVYPFLLGLLLAAPMVLSSIRQNISWRYLRNTKLPGYSLLIVYCAYIGLPQVLGPLHRAAYDVADFMDSHPGIYAMGDRAGTAGYLGKQPIIHLEGLVMDRAYLDRLKQAEQIEPLLAHYQVDYYVITKARELTNGCHFVREPANSTGYSIQLLDTICWPVVADFGPGSDGIITKILQNPETVR